MPDDLTMLPNGHDVHFAAEFPRREANVATLTARLPAPCLGIVPWMAEADVGAAAQALDGAAMLSRIPLE